MSEVLDKTVVCPLDSIVPDTGVAALIDGKQVAIFRIGDDVFAIDNHDPFSGANVLARGITGSLNGRLVVASPIYKQHFDLRTGACLEDETVTLTTYNISVDNGNVIVC